MTHPTAESLGEICANYRQVAVKLHQARQWRFTIPPHQLAEFDRRRDAGEIVTAQRRIRNGWEMVAARIERRSAVRARGAVSDTPAEPKPASEAPGRPSGRVSRGGAP